MQVGEAMAITFVIQAVYGISVCGLAFLWFGYPAGQYNVSGMQTPSQIDSLVHFSRNFNKLSVFYLGSCWLFCLVWLVGLAGCCFGPFWFFAAC